MTIEQTKSKVGKMQDSLSSIGSTILLKALQRVEREYKERVFIKGLNSSGSKIGNYSQGWAEVRKSKGLQIDFIDLKFTGSLRKSIKTTAEDNSAYMYIDDDLNYEKKYGSWQSALDVSEEEVDDLFTYFEFYLNQEIDKKLA